MRNFFRSNFGKVAGHDNAMDRQARDLQDQTTGLGGLAKGLSVSGHEIINIILLISIFASIIMLIVAFVMYFLSSRGKERDDAKQRVTRTLISVALIFMATSIVTTIFFAFYSGY